MKGILVINALTLSVQKCWYLRLTNSLQYIVVTVTRPIYIHVFMGQFGIKVRGTGHGQSVHSLIYDSRVVCFGDRLYGCKECTLGLCTYTRETGSRSPTAGYVLYTHTGLV